MWWTNSLRSSAEDLGALAENEPPTGYEPNDHIITEAYVEYTLESLGEQRFPDDFDDDHVTIGKTLLDACRRRADHSEEEGLSSCLSSSVSHDRTVRPVVCSFGPQVSHSQELRDTTQKVNRLGFSLKDKKSKFSLKLEQRFRSTNFKPILIEEVSKN